MNVTVFGAGSRGDIHPLIALVRGLQAAGYNVCLAAPEDFRPLAAEDGTPFRPLSGDMQQIMDSDTARSFIQSGGVNPMRSIRTMRALTSPVILQMAQDAYDTYRDADALILAKGRVGHHGALPHAPAHPRRNCSDQVLFD